ncbi:MAG TPA: cysteine hydrolase family protein [Xanthobacteraceae bacterium]|jgi:nicotinamidase-related amidase|nr:MAG: amidase [Rhizobiales bacterium 35-66-30]OZB05455.1 MAG: amidase [Rhizobiales bacterium 39-66-18]HQS08351.1 cysteine hydrolase family protein [Xanthobacteraceae bacterium]HQS46961.1 cysteine hydrolase family protein [Xanthobacteraceae bacterium]
MSKPHWKQRNRSLYYANAPEPDDPVLDPATTALLVIDVQNTYLERPERAGLSGAALAHYEAWTPFHDRMHGQVIPGIAEALKLFRGKGMEVLFARIACLTADGRERSLSQKKPGFNNLLLPKDEHASQIVPELSPVGDEIVLTKTTDSALTGTNLRLILHNLGVRTVVCVGIFTDQCISSTVRSLADESFDVVVLEDLCAAASLDLHAQELAILNMIYCNVMELSEFAALLAAQVGAR